MARAGVLLHGRQRLTAVALHSRAQRRFRAMTCAVADCWVRLTLNCCATLEPGYQCTCQRVRYYRSCATANMNQDTPGNR